jgi:hypothetical protein
MGAFCFVDVWCSFKIKYFSPLIARRYDEAISRPYVLHSFREIASLSLAMTGRGEKNSNM